VLCSLLIALFASCSMRAVVCSAVALVLSVGFLPPLPLLLLLRGVRYRPATALPSVELTPPTPLRTLLPPPPPLLLLPVYGVCAIVTHLRTHSLTYSLTHSHTHSLTARQRTQRTPLPVPRAAAAVVMAAAVAAKKWSAMVRPLPPTPPPLPSAPSRSCLRAASSDAAQPPPPPPPSPSPRS
jgi:hypothetical protein